MHVGHLENRHVIILSLFVYADPDVFLLYL